MIGQARTTVDYCYVVELLQHNYEAGHNFATCRHLTECGDAGDALADDQLMNVVGAFVGRYAFEIVHVAHDGVVVDDAVGAENVACLACGFEGDGDVVHFQHGDVRRIHFATVFQPAYVQGEELSLHDLGDHPGKFFLNQLMTGDRLVRKLLTSLRVLQRGVVAGHGGTQCSPAYAIADLIQTAQRAFQAGNFWKKIFFRDFAIGEGQSGGDGSSQRPFSVYIPGFESRTTLL